jgi:DNA-binding PucR family transcriptional regulator
LLQRFGSTTDVLTIDTVGLHRFLLHARQDAELLEFAHRTLDDLLAADARNGHPLLETIITYLRVRCSISKAADELVLHTNTVIYRLRRIEQLIRLDLDAPEGLMELQLALLIASLNAQAFPSIHGQIVCDLHATLAQRTAGKRRKGT